MEEPLTAVLTGPRPLLNGYDAADIPDFTANRRRQQTEGFAFHLDLDNYDARVRLLSLAERATLIGLPDRVRSLMLTAFDQRIQGGQTARRETDPLKLLADSEETINAVCVAGFIKPRLVMDEADRDKLRGVFWVGDLDYHDRQRYFQLVTGSDEQGRAAQKAAMAFLAGVENPAARSTGAPAAAAE